MNGLKVGTPIDLRTGFDILKVEGRKRAMEIIERQEPSVVFMAPECAPWSQMTNINDRNLRDEKRSQVYAHGGILCSSCHLPIEKRKTFYNGESSRFSTLVAICFQKNH